MKLFVLLTTTVLGIAATAAAEFRSIPREPMDIGTTPQFFIDDYVVDNRWAINFDRGSKEMVARTFHAPVKHPKNPFYAPPTREPLTHPQQAPTWFSVIREEDTGLFKMWYQDNLPLPGYVQGKKGGAYTTAICYAESKDGVHWVLPQLGLIEWLGSKNNNAVWLGMRGRRADAPQIVTQIPENARRGYRYVMLYLDAGIHLIGSHDGIHWDRSSDQRIHPMGSDTENNILYDPVQQEFVMYCRAKTRYLEGGNTGAVIDRGESRRVARMASKELWTEWTEEPQNILIADELDDAAAFTAFYGMTVQRYGGIFWGLLHPFKWNTDIYAELAFSRDSLRFDRLPTRPRLIDLGPAGAWDSGLIFPASNWVEAGNEWWLYYAGFNGPHGVRENEGKPWRTGGIGAVTIRKEGFISLRGPAHGGVMCTRQIRWPGGELILNADAHAGELKVRVSDVRRKVVPGFDYSDNVPFTGDQIAGEMKWKAAAMEQLKDQVVRLEFYLKDSDLYTFRASGAR